MRFTLTVILFTLIFKSPGQTIYFDFMKSCKEGLNHLKDSMNDTEFKHFTSLIDRRDTQLLKKRLHTIPASIIYIIEGYNFKKNKYAQYEEYILSPANDIKDKLKTYLNNKELPFFFTSFRIDTSWQESSLYNIVPLYPRKYQYGTGCVVSKRKIRLINKLRKKAEQEGVVVEPYCKIETIIFTKEKKIIYLYMIPRPGKRETYFVSGMNTEWPAGLDFWLFPTPNLTGD
jgi:hypothetical protein